MKKCEKIRLQPSRTVFFAVCISYNILLAYASQKRRIKNNSKLNTAKPVYFLFFVKFKHVFRLVNAFSFLKKISTVTQWMHLTLTLLRFLVAPFYQLYITIAIALQLGKTFFDRFMFLALSLIYSKPLKRSWMCLFKCGGIFSFS